MFSKLLAKQLNKFKIEGDNRIKVVNDLIENIKVIKMNVWE